MLRSSIIWTVCWLLGLLASIALIVYRLYKHDAIGATAVAAIEASQGPAIAALQQQIKQASGTADQVAIQVAKAQAELDKRKAVLVTTYQSVDLSADEVKDRLERLSL